LRQNLYQLRELKKIASFPSARITLVIGAGVPFVMSGRSEIALWQGLLRDGLKHPSVKVAREDAGNAAKFELADRVMSTSGTTDEFIEIAELIAENIHEPEYGTWLANTVGKLRVSDSGSNRMIEVLRLMRERNHLIATTNYDNILSEALGIKWITWDDESGVLKAARGVEDAVFHIHGHFEKPKSVIFGKHTYHEIVKDTKFQRVLRAIGTTSTLVFIGCNAGLMDPNIGRLLDYLAGNFGEKQMHFIVARSGEVPELEAKFSRARGFCVVNYEDTHADLAEFLFDLLPDDVPEWKTPFVGRRDELNELTSRLSLPDVRGLLLTGEPGLGKSRLAAEAAKQLRNDFERGVLWIPVGGMLASTRETVAPSVARVIAYALHLRLQEGANTQDTVIAYFRAKEVLLVLDGCEGHTSDCAELIEELVEQCPEVKLIITSHSWPYDDCIARNADLYRKFSYFPVAGLNYRGPVGQESDAKAVVEGSEAGKLFLQHFGDRKGALIWHSSEWNAILRICSALKGHPFHIEIVAGTLKARDTGGLAGGLKEMAKLLMKLGALHVVFERLPRDDQETLRRLCVLEGWGIAAAEAICTSHDLSSEMMLRAVNRLLDKSLITLDRLSSRDAERFRVPDAVRDYVRTREVKRTRTSRGSRAKPWTDVETKHMRYYVRLAEALATELPGPQEQTALNRLELEHVNLSQVLDRCLKQNDVSNALRLARCLWRYWEMRGDWVSGSKRIEAVLALSGVNRDEHKQDLSDALNGFGMLLLYQGLYSDAREAFLRSLPLRISLGGNADIAATMNNLGLVDHRIGNHAEAGRYFADALALRRQIGEPRAIASTLNNLGTLRRDEGNYADAVRLHSESVRIYNRHGGVRGYSTALSNLGEAYAVNGQFDQATKYQQESLEQRLRANDLWGIAWSYLNLGHLARWRQQYADAQTLYEKSQAIQAQIGDRRGEAYSLSDLGIVGLKQEIQFKSSTYLLRSLLMRQELNDKRGLIRSFEATAQYSAAYGNDAVADWLYTAAFLLRGSIHFHLPTVDRDCDYGAQRHSDLVEQFDGKPQNASAWDMPPEKLYREATGRAIEVFAGNTP